MDGLHNMLQSANSVIVVVRQFLAMVVLSIGIIKALKIYLADVLTPARSAWHRYRQAAWNSGTHSRWRWGF